MTIDSHHHFWRYNPHEYNWISDEMAMIRRDFEPQHLKSTIEAAGVNGVISVQARQNLEETQWLLNLARENEWIRGVVGWVPLASPQIESILERFSDENKLKAVRHVVQGEADGFLESSEFNTGIRHLSKYGLSYDILVVEKQLGEVIRFIDRHPNQIFVLDHIAKPRIQDKVLEPWKSQISELAKRENVWCKVSGMVTEADSQNWSSEFLKPYFEAVLASFGASRLLFGSDWPVCLVACGYEKWLQTVRDWAAPLSEGERAAIFGGCAMRAYQL